MSLPTHFPMKAAHGTTIQVPSVGFGTWGSGSYTWCQSATTLALRAGYRHLDCAWKYGVDRAIGAAIRDAAVPRADLFVTTKFWPQFAHPDDVATCLDLCLAGMGLEYVDLLLAHFPLAWRPTSKEALGRAWAGGDASAEDEAVMVDGEGKPVLDLAHCARDIAAAKGAVGSFVPTWQAMQALVATGKVRAVGVSNFSIAQLEELLPYSHDVPLSCNQVEAHPWLPNNDVVEFCKRQGILTCVYSPFAGQAADGRTLVRDARVVALAERNGMGVGQLLQSWAVQRGTVPLGKSQSEERIKANLAVRRLADEDMAALDAMALPHGEGRTIDYSADWGVKLFVD